MEPQFIRFFNDRGALQVVNIHAIVSISDENRENSVTIRTLDGHTIVMPAAKWNEFYDSQIKSSVIWGA